MVFRRRNLLRYTRRRASGGGPPPPTPPIEQSPSSFTIDPPGVARVGVTLRGTAATFDNAEGAPSVMWLKGDVPIPGANALDYTLTLADEGATNIRLATTAVSPTGIFATSYSNYVPEVLPPAGDNDPRLTSPRIDETGTLLLFDVAAGTWTGLLQVNPDLVAVTMTAPSVSAAGAATTALHTRRVGYRAEYDAGVLKIWLRQGIANTATDVSVMMAAGAVTGPSDATGYYAGAVSNAGNVRAPDLPKGRLFGLVQGRHDLRYGHDVVDSTFYIEAWGGHPDGTAVVKFEATVAGATVTHFVTEQSRSRYQDSVQISDAQWTANAAGGDQGGVAVYSSPGISPASLPEGPGTVTVTFYSKSGGLANARVHSWPFCNSLGGYTQRIRYVDPVAGSDSNDGLTPATAYATTDKGVLEVGSASRGATSKHIGIVYLIGGTEVAPRRIPAPNGSGINSTATGATDTWVTLEPAPGYAKQSVIITPAGQSRVRRLRFRRMMHDCANGADETATGASFLTSNNSSAFPTATNPAAIAMDDVTTYHHLGRGGQLTSTASSVMLNSYTDCLQFWMNWEHTETAQRGFTSNGVDCLRNCYIHAISSDGALEPEACFACTWRDNKVPTYGLGGLSLISGTIEIGTTVTGLLSPGVTATVAGLKGNSAVLETGGTVAYAFKRDDNGTHQEVVLTGVTGAFAVGDVVRNATSTQTGIVRQVNGSTLRVSMTLGTSFSGVLTDVTSGATGTVSSSTTRGNIFFSNGVTAKLNLPHPDGIQIQRFMNQRIRLTNIVGTFEQGEFFDIAGVTWVQLDDPKIDSLEAEAFICRSGNEILWHAVYRGRTLTGRSSGATATIVRVDHVENDANLIMHNCAFYDIDGQILFAENGSKYILFTNCIGIRPDATSPSFSKATTTYATGLWHCTLANQPWGRQDTNPVANDPFGSDLVFCLLSTFLTTYVPSGASSSDRAGSPGYDHYRNHLLQTGVFGAAYTGATTGQIAYVNGVAATQDYDAAKTDYRPAAADTVCGLIPAGEGRVKYDFLGVERPDDGTATVGALQRAA